MEKTLQAGTGWVVAQFVFLTLIATEPIWGRLPGVPDLRWGTLFSGWEPFAGALVALAGALLALWSVRALGRNLTPLPKPRDDSVLVVAGPYRWVRHPIYSALILVAAGWGLFWKDPWALALVAVLVVVFVFKTRLEERWLMLRYPEYPAYRGHTGRLFPRVF
jgi:protein-S-isoprenylcysteine O-methyltransferase Ste14